MTVSLEVLKLPSPVMMFKVVRDGEGIRNGPFLYILLLLAKTVFLSGQGECLFPLYDKTER